MTETLEQPAVATLNPFSENSWSETPIVKKEEAPKTDAAIPATNEPPKTDVVASAIAEVKTDAFDENKYLKEKWGWDNPDVAKAELEKLRKEKRPVFTNEYMESIYDSIAEDKEDELFELLDKKKQVKRLTTADLADKNNVADLVRFSIKNKNPSLEKDEVDFLFNEKFSFPVKPVQGDSDSDEEYAAKIVEWEAQTKKKEMQLMIEAKLAKPELEKLKSELVVSKIKKENQPDPEAQQKELERLKGVRTSFLQSLESDYKSFNGYEAKFQPKEGAEISANYAMTDDEKVALKKELEDFDIEGFIEKRWFKEGKANISQMMDDITLLREKEKVFQKLANEIGSKSYEQYYKIKANVNVNGNNQQNTFQPNNGKSDYEVQAAHIWNNS